MIRTMTTSIKHRAFPFSEGLVLPAFASTSVAMPGHTLVDLKSLGILPGIGGGDGRGTNAAEDLVTQTVDGVDLNDLWSEFQATMRIQNATRQTLVDFLTFTVTNPIDRVTQTSTAEFEKASEYGEPVGVRPGVGAFTLGYDFEWYDIAERYTWKFLADAPASQVQAVNAMIIEGDNRNVYRQVMRTLFRNTNRLADINGQQDVNVYALYNGDGTVPPTVDGRTFQGSHSHYMVSGTANITSEDLDDLYSNVAEHGYSWENGTTFVVLANEIEVDVIRGFRRSLGAKWDFIPAQGSPSMFFDNPDQTILGAGQVAATYAGLNVAGAYGPMLIVQNNLVPPKYVAGVATGGRANLNNPIGFREHSNSALRGLRLVKGRNPDYPLQDAFYQRGFGTGIRQRGGAAVMQIKASGSYEAPAF